MAEEEINHKRGKWELFFDEHNHKMEFIRTVTSTIGAIGGVVAVLRVLGII